MSQDNMDFSNVQTYASDAYTGKEIQNRDESYTNLLNSYITISKWRNRLKEIHKWVFFWVLLIGCGYGVCMINRAISPILSSGDVTTIIEGTPIIIASAVSCITAIIAVPLAVANFLFNTKEDDNMTSVIIHMQEHDVTILGDVKKGEKGNK